MYSREHLSLIKILLRKVSATANIVSAVCTANAYHKHLLVLDRLINFVATILVVMTTA
jgi:hypothetical protein